MKRGIVYYRDIPAGELVKDDDGYLFRYDPTYFVDPSMPEVSATLPKTQREYRSKVLFPFFFGLHRGVLWISITSMATHLLLDDSGEELQDAAAHKGVDVVAVGLQSV